MRGLLKWVGAAVVLGAAGVGVAGPAAAHQAGRAQLLIADQQVTPAPGRTHVVIRVVDADSGEPQPGFSAVAQAAPTAGGAAVAPVVLSDRGDGHYDGDLPLAVGQWSVTVRVTSGASTGAAFPVARTTAVTVAASAAAPAASSAGEAPAAAAAAGEPAAASHRRHSIPLPAVAAAVAALMGVAIGTGRFRSLRRQPAQ